MQNLLAYQYNLVKESRDVVLQFLETEVKDDFLKDIALFNDKSIRSMMVHVANTYIAWIENFIMQGNRSLFSDEEITNVDQLREIFRNVDATMAIFCSNNGLDPIQAVKGYKWVDKYIETDLYSVFSHVITHEFHHKGQSMTMSRMLGHLPPDTDILRF